MTQESAKNQASAENQESTEDQESTANREPIDRQEPIETRDPDDDMDGTETPGTSANRTIAVYGTGSIGSTATVTGGLVLSTAALVLVVGPAGLLGGVVLAVCWFALPGITAFAFSHLLLVGIAPVQPALSALVLFEIGVGALLLGPAANRPARSIVPVTIAVAGLLLTVAWTTGTTTGDLWLGAGALLGSIGAIAYGLHRYERAVLRFVEGPGSSAGVPGSKTVAGAPRSEPSPDSLSTPDGRPGSAPGGEP